MIQTADTRLIVIQHLGLSDPDFIFPWPTLIIRSPLFVNHFHILVHVYNEIKPIIGYGFTCAATVIVRYLILIINQNFLNFLVHLMVTTSLLRRRRLVLTI